MHLTKRQSVSGFIFFSFFKVLITSLLLTSCSLLNKENLANLSVGVAELYALNTCQKNRSINQQEFEDCRTETKQTYVDLKRQRQAEKAKIFIKKNDE